MASTRVLGPYLVLLLATLFSSNRLTVQAISCSQGLGAAVTNGQVLRLRRGELIILRCIEDLAHYNQLTMSHQWNESSIDRNNTHIKYTWYFEVNANETRLIYGFTREGVHNVLMNFTIQAYNLDLDTAAHTTEGQTPYPCTTPGSLPQQEDPTTGASLNAGSNRQESPPSTDDQTVSPVKTKVDTNIMLSLKIFVGVLVGLVLVLLVAVLIMALWIRQQCGRSKAVRNIEEGQKLPEDQSTNGVEVDIISTTSIDDTPNSTLNVANNSTTVINP